VTIKLSVEIDFLLAGFGFCMRKFLRAKFLQSIVADKT